MNQIECVGRDEMATNFGSSVNFDSNNNDSKNNDINKPANTADGEKSIECFADNLKFACVWQQPEVDMHIINQIMNQINCFNDNDYGDCTPSNITALISTSFPSSVTLEGFNDGDNVAECDDEKNNEIWSTFVASTPISTIKTTDVMKSIKDMPDCSNDDKQQSLLLAFNHTSPILFHSRHRSMYTKRKLHME